MDNENLYDEKERLQSQNSTPQVNTIQGIQGVDSVKKVSPLSSSTNLNLGTSKQYEWKTKTTPTTKEIENEARQEGELQFSTGVVRAADSPEAEEFLSAKELYEKTLGVTEYDELRTKLNLRNDESFTDYYNRTHYIPKGFEIQAKLLLAEEKRKKLYIEVQLGNMSEEDFLYEAYGKDLLKQQGIDFSSSLYWYNKFKQGDYDDPRKNNTFMLQVIEQARSVFQAEKWHEDLAQVNLKDMLDGLVTGVELDNAKVEEIFQEQFDELTKYYDDTAQIIKFYRAGMLKGFNPLIDIDNDGKYDYYYAPDGKLYNVNETGEGANTYKAYYNSDGSLNRIVGSDSILGEMAGGFFKSIAKFFTGVIDLGAMVTGAIVDVFDGGQFGDTLADWTASMQQFWNTTIIKDTDYIQDSGFTTSDGSFNGAVVGRQLSSLAGTIAAFVITSGLSTAVGAASKVSAGVATELPKGFAGTASKWLAKVGSSKIMSTGLGKATKFTLKTIVSTATSLTSWSNGAFGSSLGARLGTSLMLSTKDCLNSVATLAANQKVLGLSDSEVVTHAVGGAAVNFAATFFLRQVADQGAMRSWAQMAKKLGKLQSASASGAIAQDTASNLFSKILMGTLSGKEKLAVGLANVAMDQIENTVTAWTQASLSSTGDVFNMEALKGLWTNPSFIANSLYQAHMSLKDELKIDKNKIIGATTDTVEMDQKFRAMVAEARENNKGDDEAIKAIDTMIIDYDKEIKNKMTQENPVTKAKYTRAEATLAALEKATVSMDLGSSNTFIKYCQDKVKKFITDQKIMYAQAVFNMANSTYSDYNRVLKEGFNVTNVFNNIYRGKDVKKLLEIYADNMQKYFAIPIDKQLFIDTYDTTYLSALSDKVNNQKTSYGITDDLVNIGTGVESVTLNDQGKNDIKFVYDDLRDEAKTEYNNKVVNIYGMNNDRTNDTFIRFDNKGNADQVAQNELKKLMDATAEVELELSGINSSYNPFIIKIDEGVYVIPAIGGMGNQLDKVATTGLLFNIYRLAKYHYDNNNNSELKDNILDIIHAFNPEVSSSSDAETIKKHLVEIRKALNTLCGKGKALSEVDGARLLNILLQDSRFDGLDRIETNEESYNQFKTFINLRKLEQDYIEAKDAFNYLANNKDISESVLKDKYSILENFKQNYLQDKNNEYVRLATEQGAISSELLKRLNVPFVRDRQEGSDLKDLITYLRKIANNKTAIDQETKRAVVETLLDKLGYKSEPTTTDEVEAEMINSIEQALADLYFVGTEMDRGIGKKLRKPWGDELRDTYTAPIKELVDLLKSGKKISPKKFEDLILNTSTLLDDKRFDKYRDKQVLKTQVTQQDYEEFVDTAISSIKEVIADTVASKYTKTDPDLKVEILKAIDNSNDINIMLTKATDVATKKYKYTLDDYKDIETIFNRDIEIANKLLNKSTTLKARNLLVIDLNRVTGSETASILNKFKNDKILDDFINGDDTSKINQLFGGDPVKKANFRRELKRIQQLKHDYADSILYFELNNEAEVSSAKRILSDLYNFNYTLRTADDQNLPGVYLMSKNTEGVTINTSLNNIKTLANNYDANINRKDIELANDFFGIFESFASGFTFLKDTDKINFNDEDNIIINNMIADSNTHSYTSAVTYINHIMDVKLGKLAGKKVSNIALGYTALALSDNDVDMDMTQKHFVRTVLTAASNYFTGENSVPIKVLADKEARPIYEKFYTTEKQGNYYILTPKISSDKFVDEAYKQLEANPKSLPYILAINGDSTKHNNLIGSDSNKPLVEQRTTGYTPYSYALERFNEQYHLKDIQKMFETVLSSSIKFTKEESDIGEAQKALAKIFKKHTVREVIDDYDNQKTSGGIYNNIYYQMEISALKAALEVTNASRAKLSDVNDNVFNMIGNRNFRANLAVAMNQKEVKDNIEFENGYLKITDKLLDSIIKVYKPEQARANKEDAITTLDTTFTTDEVKQILTGSQTGYLDIVNNKDNTIDINKEDLATVLKLYNIESRNVINKDLYNNPIDTFYAMCLANTDVADNRTASISLKNIHHLSNDDCVEILKEMKKILSDTEYNKLRNIIYLVKTGEEYKQGMELKSDTYEDIQREEIKPIKTVAKTTSDGFIAKVDENGEVTKGREIILSTINKALRQSNLKEELKISSILDKEQETFNRKFYEFIAKRKMPNATNKGSILVGNMNIASNRAALFSTLAHLSQFLQSQEFASYINLSGKNNKKLTAKEATDLALDLYAYTTGDDYQPNYQQYILYDKKHRRILSSASNSYRDDYDNLVTELFMHTNIDLSTEGMPEFLNKTDSSKPSSKDIVIISVPRNALSSIYTPDLDPNIEIITLDEPDALGRSKAQVIINYSYRNFLDRTKDVADKSNDELKDLYITNLYNHYVKQAKAVTAKTDELASKFAVDTEAVKDVFDSKDSYSFTQNSNTKREQLTLSSLGLDNNKTNILLQKEKELLTYGITEDYFNSIKGFTTTISDIRKQTLTDLDGIDTKNLDEFIDALSSGDLETARTAAIAIKSTVLNKTNEDKILRYIVANTNNLDTKMFMLLGKDISDYQDVSIKDLYKFKLSGGDEISIDEFDFRNKTVGDAESVYEGNLTLPYQIAMEIKGKVYEFFKPLDIPGIQEAVNNNTIRSGEDLALYIKNKGFKTWYNDTYKEKGTKQAIQKLFEAYKNNSFNNNYDKLNDIDENSIFLGFNNSNYDDQILIEFFKEYPNVIKMIENNSLDSRYLAQEVPTTIHFRFQKNEGTLAGTATAANIKLEGSAHDASSDITTTAKLIEAIKDSIVATNHYQNKIVDYVDTIKELLDINKDLRIQFNSPVSLDKEAKIIYNKLKNITSNDKAVERLKDITAYRNYRNSIEAVNMSDVLTRDIRKQIFNGLSDAQITFANTFNKPKIKRETAMILSVAIDKEYQELVGQYGSNATFEVAKNRVVQKLIGDNFVKSSENDLLKEVSNKNLKSKLNINDEDIEKYKANTTNVKYNIYNDDSLNDTEQSIAEHRTNLLTKSIQGSVYYSLNELENYITDLLKDYSKTDADKLTNYIIDELHTFFDVRSDLIQRDKNGEPVSIPKPNWGSLINAVSQIDDDTFNYILQDPFLNKGYKEIYRLVTAPPIDQELKLVNGNSMRLPNDTLAITQKQLANLMDVSGLTEDMLRQDLGLNTNDTIYIPVIRHPLDKTDSVQFLKLMLIEEGQGIDVAVSADTMLTRFNGDLDGDHIMILKPSKTMEEFANTKDAKGNTLANLQHEPLSLLNKVLEDNNISFNHTIKKDNVYYENLIVQNKKLNNKILTSLEKYYPANPEEYEAKRKLFSDEIAPLLESAKFYDDTNTESLDDIIKDIFWKTPIDMTGLNTGDTRFITFTDYAGIHTSDNLNNLNLQNRRRYRFGEISTYGILRHNDSISGTLTKQLFNKKQITIDDLHFVENLIRLSGTTKSALNNLDTDTQNTILNDLVKLSGFKKKDISRFDNIKSFADKVEQALLFKQLLNMDKRQELSGKALSVLQSNQDNSPESKFFKGYLNPETNIDNDTIPYAINDILEIKRSLANSYSSDNNIDTNEMFDNIIRLMGNRIPEKTKSNNTDIYTKMPVLYIKRQADKSHISLDVVGTEDTILPLAGLKKYEVRNPKIYNLNTDNESKFNKLKTNDLLNTSQLKSIGLDTELEGTVRFVTKNDDNIIVTLSSSLEGQKIVFKDNDASKSTVSMYADDKVTGVKQDVLNDCAFVRLFGKDSFKKMTDTPFKNKKVVCYQANGSILNNVDISDNRVAYFTVIEDVNAAEVPAFYDQTVKTSKFEELAHGNNIDSINGMFLYDGYLYKVNDDGTISFDNSKLVDIKNKIDSACRPSRTDSNAYDLYCLLKALVIAKEVGLSDSDITTIIEGGPDMWETYANNEIGQYRPIKNKNYKEALLSKELKDFMEQSLVTRTNATITDNTKARSENAAYTDIQRQSNNSAQQFATGELTNMLNNKTGYKAKPFVSKLDFINELNKLAGTNSYLRRHRIEEGDAQGLFNNGEFMPRTQISNGPRSYYDTDDVDVTYNSKIHTKTGDIINTQSPTTRNTSLLPDLDSYKTREPFNYHDNKHFHKTKTPYVRNKNDISAGYTDRFNGVLELLKTPELNTDVDYALALSNKHKNAKASIKTGYRGFTSEGDLTYTTKATLLNDTDKVTTIGTTDLLKRINDLGKSSEYYEGMKNFKEDVSIANTKNAKLTTEPTTTKDIKNIVDNLDTTPIDDLHTKQEALRQSFKEANTIDEVIQNVNQRFYNGASKDDDTKFTVEKIRLNKGIKLDSSEAVQADRIIKGMESESNSIAISYEKDLINLYNIAGRNGSIEELNKFAYILAAKNKLDIIDAELTKFKNNTSKNKLLLEAKEDVNKALTKLNIQDAEAYINNFGKVHKEEAALTYMLLKQLNVEASKYSNLCGEPGQNIFFLLTPSVKNTKLDNTAKAKYVMSMIARGNNPLKYNKELNNYTYDSMPVYDGYNFISSLTTSINAVSKQAAIYNNSMRLKQLGFMENVSIAERVINTISKPDFIENINSKYLNKDADIACRLYISGLIDKFSNNPDLTRPLNALQKSDHLTIVEKYNECLLLLQGYINMSGVSFQEASQIRTTSNDVEIDTKNYDNIVFAYNVYADTVAQLSGLCDDKLLETIYTEITSSIPKGKVLVDKFGRKLDDLYGLSENSLECYLDYMDGHFDDSDINPKRSYMRRVIDKALTGDLYLIDSVLADTMANNVFVKIPTGKIKNTLKKTSSFCVKALMSNPFKLLDRFVKFTMFDTATLGTADAKTLLKQPQAYMDLRAYFSSKGAAQSEDLSEFLYTQGIKLNNNNFDTIYNNSDSVEGFNPLKTYTDMTGKVFTFQTLSVRYAYWLAAKEAIAEGDYSVLGSAYYLKDKIKDLDAIYKDEIQYNADGTTSTKNVQKVSKEGQQAAFAMAQNIGAPNDFPEFSKTANSYGAVFTTFPMAAVRWGINEARSLTTIATELFKGQFNSTSAKWLFRNGSGIIGTFIAEQLLVSLIADMFGIQSILDKKDDEDEEDERVKEWKETGALPNITQTIFTGQPIMDTYSSMNMTRQVKGMIVDPFIPEESNSSGGISRFFYKNILSHINPIAKSATEIALNKDLIDDKVIDTKDKYTMLENVMRKMSSYIIGSAGANAFVNAQTDNNIGEDFFNGLNAAVSAECGNTKVYKENLKNYYKSLNKLNSYLYKDSDNEYTQSNEMTTLKKEIRKLITEQPKITNVYSLLNKYLSIGYSASEVRQALRACSIQYKLEQVQDMDDLRDCLTDSSYANIKTAIEFENYMYPWLDEGIDYLTRYINQNKTANSRSLYYKNNYYNNNYSNNSYNKLNTSNNYNNSSDPFNSYNNMISQQEYNKRQAEYKRNQQKYGGR